MPKRRHRRVPVVVDGKRTTLSQLWFENGRVVTYPTALARVKKGMDPLEAVTTPSRVKTTERKTTNRKQTTETLTLAAIDWAVVRCRLGVTKEIAVTFGSKRLRVDLLGVTYGTLEFTGFEVKSCHADFACDKKWMKYIRYFEKFYFVMSQDYYESDRGKDAVATVREKGCGVLVLMGDGFCYVKHKAKALPGLKPKDKLPLVSKILWKSSHINRANHPRRTRRYL